MWQAAEFAQLSSKWRGTPGIALINRCNIYYKTDLSTKTQLGEYNKLENHGLPNFSFPPEKYVILLCIAYMHYVCRVLKLHKNSER